MAKQEARAKIWQRQRQQQLTQFICDIVETESHVKNGMFNIKKENMASGP